MCASFPAVICRYLTRGCAGLLLLTLFANPVTAQQDSTGETQTDTLMERSDSPVTPDPGAADSVAVNSSGVDSSDVSVTDAEESSTPDSLTVAEADLRAVARALIAIDELRREYHAKQGLPNDSGSVRENVHSQFKAEATRVIEAEGISVDLYVRITQAARQDPELHGRLANMIAEIQGR